MWAWFYQHNPLLVLPIVAMLIFMTVWMVATVRAWRRGALPEQQQMAQLPLQDDEILTPSRSRS